MAKAVYEPRPQNDREPATPLGKRLQAENLNCKSPGVSKSLVCSGARKAASGAVAKLGKGESRARWRVGSI